MHLGLCGVHGEYHHHDHYHCHYHCAQGVVIAVFILIVDTCAGRQLFWDAVGRTFCHICSLLVHPVQRCHRRQLERACPQAHALSPSLPTPFPSFFLSLPLFLLPLPSPSFLLLCLLPRDAACITAAHLPSSTLRLCSSRFSIRNADHGQLVEQLTRRTRCDVQYDGLRCS